MSSPWADAADEPEWAKDVPAHEDHDDLDHDSSDDDEDEEQDWKHGEYVL